jgi:hypothetical protein
MENDDHTKTSNRIAPNNITIKKARHLYIKNKFKSPTSETRLINAGLDIKTIKAVYKLPFLVTRNISLSIFQFKINHNILYTKSMLFRDKLAPNDLCHLCSGKQTLNHLSVACSYVFSFWREFEL